MITLPTNQNNNFVGEVNKKSDCNILDCYQCGKCAASCPVSSYMTYSPRKIFQLVKLGLRDEVYRADSTWYCLSCASCSARCPREIDIPRAMEAIRHLAIEQNIYPDSKSVKDIKKFHEIFLDMVKKYGRLYEMRMMGEFNMRTGHFFKDMDLAPATLLKGKLKLLPQKLKNMKSIKKIFSSIKKSKKGESK